MRLLWAVLAGTRVEIISDDPREMWELFAKGYVTQFSAPPVIFAALMRYFKEYIDPLPAQQRSRYMEGVSVLQRVVVSGGVTWPNVMKFWKDMLGRPLTNMYSSTEVTAALETTDDTDPNLEVSKYCKTPHLESNLSYNMSAMYRETPPRSSDQAL